MKRLLIPLATVLGMALIALVIMILQLYVEAEKVQRNIFTSEVLTAGDKIVNKISAVMAGDTLPLATADSLRKDSDSSKVIFEKFARKFLLDKDTKTPIGVVKSIIYYKENDVIITNFDTIYFDTSYYRNPLALLSSSNWESEIPATQFEEKNVKANKSKHSKKKGKDELREMDSATVELLNKDFLYRIIKEYLLEEAITAQFDFGLYNALTNTFVVEPTFTSHDAMLKSEYVFTLKPSENLIAPHYLILYFPSEREFFLQRMSLIAGLIASFLIIIMTISAYTLFYIYRQKKLSDIKNDFMNNMTHEFKTPISTISLACEAISDGNVISDRDSLLAYVSIIKDENERLKTMSNNILQLALLKRGQLKMEIERFDIHEVIKHILDSIYLQVSSKNGKLHLSLDAENPVIYADKSHIENVIINLIENAIKYSEENPSIQISTKNDKKYLILSVQDNGIGISKKNQRKIFQEFYRASKGNVHNTKGFGLGLGYVKKIVFLHGGFVTVKSEVKKGSVFTLYLPIKNKKYGYND